MATTSIWSVKGWLGKLVIYVENPNKTTNPQYYEKAELTEKQAQTLLDVIDYAADPVAVEFGTPTIPKLVHDQTFNWWDNYPPMPEPYETWCDAISYGPEGYQPPDTFQFGAQGGRNYK